MAVNILRTEAQEEVMRTEVVPGLRACNLFLDARVSVARTQIDRTFEHDGTRVEPTFVEIVIILKSEDGWVEVDGKTHELRVGDCVILTDQATVIWGGDLDSIAICTPPHPDAQPPKI